MALVVYITEILFVQKKGMHLHLMLCGLVITQTVIIKTLPQALSLILNSKKPIKHTPLEITNGAGAFTRHQRANRYASAWGWQTETGSRRGVKSCRASRGGGAGAATATSNKSAAGESILFPTRPGQSEPPWGWWQRIAPVLRQWVIGQCIGCSASPSATTCSSSTATTSTGGCRNGDRRGRAGAEWSNLDAKIKSRRPKACK